MDLLPQLQRLQADKQALEHQLHLDVMAFHLITEQPHHASLLAEKALERHQKRSAA